MKKSVFGRIPKKSVFGGRIHSNSAVYILIWPYTFFFGRIHSPPDTLFSKKQLQIRQKTWLQGRLLLELNQNACPLAAEMVVKNYTFLGNCCFFNAKRTMAVADLPPKTPTRPQQKKERVRRRMHSNFRRMHSNFRRIHSFSAEYTLRRIHSFIFYFGNSHLA